VFEGVKYYLLTQPVKLDAKYQEHRVNCYAALKMKTASFSEPLLHLYKYKVILLQARCGPEGG
jgi:hypothetical protein